jgi:hypothetical protein
MQLADDKLGVNCEPNVEKIVVVSVKRLFIQEQNNFFDISCTIHPHLSYASYKGKTVIS